jgi:hypothetical protein
VSLPIRSAERRRWAAALVEGPAAGLVVHGAGGIGKSRLAAAIAERIGQLEPGRVAVTLGGEVSADRILAGIDAALPAHPAATRPAGPAAGRAEPPWPQRLARLREHGLGRVPVLLVLDDFDDNLSVEPGTCAVPDPALAGLLASWTGEPPLGKLLITCRRQFVLAGEPRPALAFRCLGPLPRSAAAELAKSLPACGRLGDQELDRAWRLTGGHPMALEYLDRVLAGTARFPEVALRVAAAIEARTGQAVQPTGPEPPAEISPAAAEMIAVAAAGALLGELWWGLSAGAQAVLVGASVYRGPAPPGAPLLPAPPGPPPGAGVADLLAECAAAGLLTAGPDGVFVHRWTASQLHRRLAESDRGGDVAAAHRRAADYWWWRVDADPADDRWLREAKYHLAQAGHLARPARSARHGVAPSRRRLRAALAVAGIAAVAAGGGVAATHLASSLRAGHPGEPASGPGAYATAAVAAREQAAAWVAAQVGGHTTVACDPAMCAALRARGFPAGELVVLPAAGRPGSRPLSPGPLGSGPLGSGPLSPGPLGTGLVIATAAVRGEFGARLASVYAPEVVASFGAGPQRIDVRAVAAGGAAAYQAELASDLAARKTVGNELLRNPAVSVSAAARSQLAAGEVDSRLLIVLATMAAAGPVQVRSFGDSGPGASAGVPLRAAEITVATGTTTTAGATGAASPAARLRYLLAFVRAQRPPYRPAQARIVRSGAGPGVLAIEFAAPSPLGLLPATER